jgi:hypothetical protein
MIQIDAREANAELERLKNKLSPGKIASATRMALNESIRKGKTQISKAVREVYNIKPSLLNDPNKKKGLSLKLASNNNLSAEVDAGHTPLGLENMAPQYSGTTVANKINFKNGKAKKGGAIKRSTGQISIEVIKGQRKTLGSAFAPGLVKGGSQATNKLFARGKKGKPGFEFAKPRNPIDTISSISVATAAMNSKSAEKYDKTVQETLTNRSIHHLKRAAGEIQ